MLASIYVKQCFKSVDRKREIVVDYDNLVTDVAKSKKKIKIKTEHVVFYKLNCI